MISRKRRGRRRKGCKTGKTRLARSVERTQSAAECAAKGRKSGLVGVVSLVVTLGDGPLSGCTL